MFVDIMIKGALVLSVIHTKFVEKPPGTLIIDTFDYMSPFGPVGIIADKLFLEKYMKEFIISRAKELKRVAENINQLR